MNILISDYDGTIKTFDNNPNIFERYTFKKNISAINKFVEKGNNFIISTGRSTDSIQDEVKKNGINYNYLITYNGRVILDQNNKIIYANYIDNNFLKEFKSNKLIKDLQCYNEFGYTDDDDNSIYIQAKINSYKEIKKILLDWKEKYPNIKIDYSIILKMLTIRSDFNKSLGIKVLLEKEYTDIEKENIITVGDEKNDIEMIKDYNGYRMLLSNPKLILASNNVTTSVHKLIKKIY